MQQHLPRRCQRDGAPTPFDEPRAQLVLDLLHRARERWLGDAQALRRAGEIHLLGHRLEVTQMSQVHARPLNANTPRGKPGRSHCGLKMKYTAPIRQRPAHR